MKEIIELSERIRNEAPEAVPKEFGWFLVNRQGEGTEELQVLPPAIKDEVERLRARLDAAIPDDFQYQLCLGDDKPGLSLVYCDGAQTEADCPVEWDETRSIFDQLQGVDWEKERGRVLAMCQDMERMKEEAQQKKPTLPSTKQIQKTFRSEMDLFVKTKRKDASQVHVLVWDDGEGSTKEENFENMDAFRRELPDIMAMQLLVIAVVADGKPLPVAKIGELKKQALQELEDMPISHAKALGQIGGWGV